MFQYQILLIFYLPFVTFTNATPYSQLEIHASSDLREFLFHHVWRLFLFYISCLSHAFSRAFYHVVMYCYFLQRKNLEFYFSNWFLGWFYSLSCVIYRQALKYILVLCDLSIWVHIGWWPLWFIFNCTRITLHLIKLLINLLTYIFLRFKLGEDFITKLIHFAIIILGLFGLPRTKAIL